MQFVVINMTRNAQMSADIGPVLFHPRVPVSTHFLVPYSLHYSLQAGMRSYFNGSTGLAATPPPASAGLGPGRPHPVTSGRLVTGRASSSSLPRSPDQDNSLLTSGLGTGSGQSGHGSLGSHSSHEVSYMNIYQNTNIPHIYVSHTQLQAGKHLSFKLVYCLTMRP